MQLRPNKQEAQKLWQSRHMERLELNIESWDVWDAAGRESELRYVTMPQTQIAVHEKQSCFSLAVWEVSVGRSSGVEKTP